MTHMAMDHPSSGIISNHVCIKSASRENTDLVGEAARVVEDHAMPVRRFGLLSTCAKASTASKEIDSQRAAEHSLMAKLYYKNESFESASRVVNAYQWKL